MCPQHRASPKFLAVYIGTALFVLSWDTNIVGPRIGALEYRYTFIDKIMGDKRLFSAT